MIELKQVSFTYQGQEHDGLRDINLTIADGECVLFCGRSGCGKTTITRLANGLIPQFYAGELTGSVRVNGQEISSLPMYQIAAEVGSVFQNPRTQFFNVDTDSEIAFGIENEARPPQELAERVEQTTEDLHIRSLRGRNIFELSGGEKQKIAFASVYAMNPEIYLLDEPSSNLDMTSIQELREHLRLIKGQGKTILIAEHRLYYLKELIDRVLYLNDGRIEKDYTAQEALSLSTGQQISMGLRPFELAAFPSTPHPFDEKGQIQCENFHFAYTKHRDALNIDCLSLPEGGIVALIGHNGAGKSTLARCLCGLEKHCDGVVKMNGKQYNKKQRLALCYMVMQDVNHQLFTESTEEEMLISMAAPSPDRAGAVLERLDLMQFKDRHPMALSGGQKQRVAIATALVSDRKILVFDEPTSGLDLHHMKEVAEELLAIQDLGKTSLVITHDYELIASCCTHVLHLEHGEVQEQYALDNIGIQHLKEFFIGSR